jgi:hypothetical protein
LLRLAWRWTYTAAVTTNETWNGTSWTEVNEMNTARWFVTGAGTTNIWNLAAVGVITITSK